MDKKESNNMAYVCNPLGKEKKIEIDKRSLLQKDL